VNWISRGGFGATATVFYRNTSLSVTPPLFHTVLSSDGIIARSETTISWESHQLLVQLNCLRPQDRDAAWPVADAISQRCPECGIFRTTQS